MSAALKTADKDVGRKQQRVKHISVLMLPNHAIGSRIPWIEAKLERQVKDVMVRIPVPELGPDSGPDPAHGHTGTQRLHPAPAHNASLA